MDSSASSDATRIAEVVERDLLGKPFELWGRGPDSFDCWGLVLWVYREAFSVDVPNYITMGDTLSVRTIIERTREFFEKMPDGDHTPGNCLFLVNVPEIHLLHTAIVENDLLLVEAGSAFGVRRTRVNFYDYLKPQVYRPRCLLSNDTTS